MILSLPVREATLGDCCGPTETDGRWGRRCGAIAVKCSDRNGGTGVSPVYFRVKSEDGDRQDACPTKNRGKARGLNAKNPAPEL